MSKPSSEQIARALGVPLPLVGQLAKRGMPVRALSKAVAWYAMYGMRSYSPRPHAIRRASR